MWAEKQRHQLTHRYHLWNRKRPRSFIHYEEVAQKRIRLISQESHDLQNRLQSFLDINTVDVSNKTYMTQLWFAFSCPRQTRNSRSTHLKSKSSENSQVQLHTCKNISSSSVSGNTTHRSADNRIRLWATWVRLTNSNVLRWSAVLKTDKLVSDGYDAEPLNQPSCWKRTSRTKCAGKTRFCTLVRNDGRVLVWRQQLHIQVRRWTRVLWPGVKPVSEVFLTGWCGSVLSWPQLSYRGGRVLTL